MISLDTTPNEFEINNPNISLTVFCEKNKIIYKPNNISANISYYTSMTFLMMLSVILPSMLMILLSILSVIGHLICGNNLNWFLKLNLIYKTLWTGVRSGFSISMLGLTFSSKLEWGSYIISKA